MQNLRCKTIRCIRNDTRIQIYCDQVIVMIKYYINEYFIICQNFTEVAVCYNQGITVYIILQQDVV